METLLRRPLLRALGVLAALGGAAYLIYLLRGVLTPLLIAFFIAYLTAPWVEALERRGLSRGKAIATLIAAVVLGLGLLVLILVPLVQDQVQRVAQRVPGYLEVLRGRSAPLLDRLDPQLVDTARQRALEWLKANYGRLLSPAAHFLTQMFSGLANFVLGVLNLVMIPVFSVYILADLHRIQEQLARLIPHRFRPGVVGYLAQVNEILSAFIRGQLTVCLALSVVYSFGLSLTGVPMPLLVGIFSGFLNLIPYMGIALGMTSAVTLTLLDGRGIAEIAGVVLTFVIGQMLEGFVITPRVVGKKLGLHPLAIMLSVLVGGTLFGFFGILLAVPGAACLAVVARQGLTRYLDSEFYRGRPPGMKDG